MTIAKILAPLTGSPADEIVLSVAYALARPQDAYVDAAFVFPDPREAIPVTEMPMSPEIYQQIVDAAEKARKRASKSAREAFSVRAAACNAKIVSAPEKHSGIITTYREVPGHLEEVLREAALFADVVVFPPLAGDEFRETHDALIAVLMKSDRPVVLCPRHAPGSVGQSVLIGWDGGVAAAQALNAAMPILEKAGSVRFACVRPDNDSSRPLKDAKEYLALHGIDAGETLIPKPRLSIAHELLETAQKNKCDLLVAGGYGHSRILETIFGGTTDTLLSHSHVPLFLAH
ncbi:MAG TPA: universal stress protein [Rhizomicrobium sp.]|nr:universal stress protein [Rhizomicrobium sp.]